MEPKWKADRCEHCRTGVPMSSLPGKHWTGNHNPPLCTAPTEEEYIVSLEAENARLKQERETSDNEWKQMLAESTEAIIKRTKELNLVTRERDEALAVLRAIASADDGRAGVMACEFFGKNPLFPGDPSTCQFDDCVCEATKATADAPQAEPVREDWEP